MTDQPKPSAAALAAADAICTKHGMLPGGYMRDSLAEDLEAFARSREGGADRAARAMEDERAALASAIEAADQEWDHEPAPAGTYWASLAAAVRLFYESKHSRLYHMWNDKIEAAEDARDTMRKAIEATLSRAPVPQDPIWDELNAVVAVKPEPVATMLGQPIGMDDLTRISRDGP
jgi:hypothetical protein